MRHRDRRHILVRNELIHEVADAQEELPPGLSLGIGLPVDERLAGRVGVGLRLGMRLTRRHPIVQINQGGVYLQLEPHFPCNDQGGLAGAPQATRTEVNWQAIDIFRQAFCQ